MLSVGLSLAQVVSSGEANARDAAARVARAPLFWAAAVGLTLSTLNVPLPELVLYLLQALSRSASPTALFALGAFLQARGIREGLSRPVSISAYKLLALPAIAYATSRALGLGGVQLGCTLLLSAAPPAITNFVVVDKFGLDVEAVASAIVLSTLAALLRPSQHSNHARLAEHQLDGSGNLFKISDHRVGGPVIRARGPN